MDARRDASALIGGYQVAGINMMRGAALGILAQAHQLAGDLPAGAAAAAEALQISDQYGDSLGRTFAHVQHAAIAIAAEDLDEAEDAAQTGLASAISINARPMTVRALEILARVRAADSPAEAARLLAATDNARSIMGLVPGAAERALLGEARVTIEHRLQDVGEVLVADTAPLDLEGASEYLRRGRGQRRRPSSGWASLTPTEQQVVRLVAEGLTNPQIGERLFVTRGTVKTHLTHVFAKLGVTTRAELAAAATRHGS